MSILAMSRRDRRALGGGIATVVAAVLAFRGIPAVTRWTAAQRQTARREIMDAADSRRATRAFPWMRDSARARRLRLSALDSVFLPATEPALAAAALTAELSDDAEQTGVAVAVVQAEPLTSGDSTLRRVRARLTVSGRLDGVMRFLVFVEAGTPLLTIRELAIAQHSGQPAAGRGENLRADLLVEGLVKPRLAAAGDRHE